MYVMCVLVMQPELEEIGTRKRLRSGTLVQQPHVGHASKPKPTVSSSPMAVSETSNYLALLTAWTVSVLNCNSADSS